MIDGKDNRRHIEAIHGKEFKTDLRAFFSIIEDELLEMLESSGHEMTEEEIFARIEEIFDGKD